jgi:hypothetical protein
MIQDYIESMIHEAKRTNGVIVFNDRKDNSIESILSSIAKSKMISYDLIIQDDEGKWILNKRGLNFKSFRDERRKQVIEQHPYLKDFLLVLIGAGLSLLIWLVQRQLDNQQHRQEMEQLKEKMDRVIYRLDSLTNHLIYQQPVQDLTKD